ncbi:hypothetical protein ACJX0J_034696 [Zea mays]
MDRLCDKKTRALEEKVKIKEETKTSSNGCPGMIWTCKKHVLMADLSIPYCIAILQHFELNRIVDLQELIISSTSAHKLDILLDVVSCFKKVASMYLRVCDGMMIKASPGVGA